MKNDEEKNQNVENNKKGNKIGFIILGIIVVILIAVVIFLALKLNNSNNGNTTTMTSSSTSNNENTNNKEENNSNGVSFKSMDATDTSLTEDQREIAKFFDDDYFHLSSYTELVRYADMLKNINISTYCQVYEILSSDSEEFEAVCQWGSDISDFYGIVDVSDMDLTTPIIIKGKKPEKMVLQTDMLAIRGKLVGAETRTINGQNKYLPIIEITEIGENSNWYSEETLRNVAKLVFGDNIKFRKPTDEEMYKMCQTDYISYESWIYLAEFENQSNLNFKVFDIWQSNPYGLITYNYVYNQGLEKDYLNKRLYITPDLQKYIVFDMSTKDKYVYISVYDRNLNKLWQREISNATQITWDATNTNLVFVSDNDFYNIDIESGNDAFSPVFVGKKDKVSIVNNGYILVSEDSDDSVMFLDLNGNIKNKFDINLSKYPNAEIYSISLQKIDSNYVILYNLYDSSESYENQLSSKYIIIDENGNKVKESE